MVPSQTCTSAGEFGAAMSTRSPGRSPRAPRAVAAPRTESASCLKDSEDSVVPMAGASPHRFAAALTTSGTVARLLAKDLLGAATGPIHRGDAAPQDGTPADR